MRTLRIWVFLPLFLAGFSFTAAQDKPLQIPMQAYNIEVAQKVVNALGYDVTVKEGIIIGPEAERQKGTAICTFYAEDKNGNWYGFALKMTEGKIYEFKGGPVEAPGNKVKI